MRTPENARSPAAWPAPWNISDRRAAFSAGSSVGAS